MNKVLKRIGVLALVLVCASMFTACGKQMPYSQYDLNDYITVSEYKGLKVEPYEVTVSQASIDARIDEKLDEAKVSKSLKEGEKVINGDVCNIDYVGTLNGKAFEGGSAEGYDLVIGSGAFIEGFESGLIGKKCGEKNIKLNLAFPVNYGSEELAGKDVVFTVNINSVNRDEKPEFNMDFIKTQGDYKNEAEYRKAIEDELYKEQEAQAKEGQKTQLWDQVLTNTEVKQFPEEEVNNYMEFNSKQIDDYAKEAGCTRDEMLIQYGFKSEEDFQKVNQDSTEVRVKQEMIIVYIADQEDLTYTDEEKNAMLSDIEAQGYNEESILQSTGRTADDYVHLQLLYQKVGDFLLDNAKVEK